MDRASPSTRAFALTATVLTCLVGLSACEKPAVPAPADTAATTGAQPAAAPAVAAVPLQPETAIAATGVLTPANKDMTLVPVAAIPQKGPSCNLEVIAGVNTTEPKIEVKAGSSMSVSGWMYSAPTQSVPVNRYLRVETEDGASAWETILGKHLDRPDILPWFNIGDWALSSGFEQDVALGKLPAGRYHLLLTYTENGQTFVCDNGRLVTVTP
jgi:hypothetical protein